MSPGKILTGQPAHLPPLRTVMSDEDKLFVAALNLELKFMDLLLQENHLFEWLEGTDSHKFEAVCDGCRELAVNQAKLLLEELKS